MEESNREFDPDYSENLLTLEQLQEIKGNYLLEFGAPWCGHCQSAFSATEELLNETPDLKHIKIYDGKGKKLGRIFGVKLWPTFIFMKNNNEVARVVRPTNIQQLREIIKV
ncbi:thioredoxin family protein [Psychromonas sp. KJ10-10]|uniref:thioredoxin family protein n=1 Tax=Psychromonas sp. KJ10-10 TaxID=3391823 RepID=UPI0039B4D400